MGLVAATGLSRSPYADTAANEALSEALRKFGSERPLLALIFASVHYDQDRLMEAIVKGLPPGVQTVGCSDAGEITESGAEKKSLVIMLLGGQGVGMASGTAGDLLKDGAAAGNEIVELLHKQVPNPVATMLFSDSLSLHAEQVICSIPSLESEIIAGAGAADDFYFRKTYQYFQGKVQSGTIAGLSINNISAGYAIAHGWRSLGMAKRVTKTQGTVVNEIDGKPAMQFYEEFFGADNIALLRRESMARLAITYPIGYYNVALSQWLVRYPLSANDDGSLVMSASIPNGATVDLMIGGKKEAIAAATQVATQAVQQLGGKPIRAAVVFSSVARDRLFGLDIDLELAAIKEVIGQTVPLIGFYGYAEFGSIVSSKLMAYHNEAISLLLLGDV